MDLNLLKSTVDQVHPLNEEAWATFSRLWQTSSFERGEYFARAGDFPTSMAFVQEGVFRAFYRNEEGTEYNKTFFIEGTLMAPLAALILRQENQINLQALTLAKVLTAPFDSLTALYDAHPAVERFARKVIELEWCKKEIREIRMALNSAEERYDFFLEEHPDLENRIPQYHIASYLGINAVSLSRIRGRR